MLLTFQSTHGETDAQNSTKGSPVYTWGNRCTVIPPKAAQPKIEEGFKHITFTLS